MNRHSGAKGHKIPGMRIGRGAAVLEIDFQLRDVIVLFVRRSGQGEFLPQHHVLRQRPLELDAPLPRHDRKLLEHRRRRLLDNRADRQALTHIQLHRRSVLPFVPWQNRLGNSAPAIRQQQLEIGIPQRRRFFDERRRSRGRLVRRSSRAGRARLRRARRRARQRSRNRGSRLDRVLPHPCRRARRSRNLRRHRR